ncbi:MAG: hypothetical protein HYV35_00865 [Lentisphaerae bacterium]|nr:hypothetical protein [Lentisphaerota bacterium]
MRKASFEEVVAQIQKEDPRYAPEAYFFIREALDFTARLLKKPAQGPGRHVSAAELLEGIRQFALHEYGALAMTVLNDWGLRSCADFGQVVFHLVNKEFLGKTEGDSISDFDHGYDFASVFRAPFAPEKKCRSAPQRGATS